VGSLFKRNNRDLKKRELVFLLKPTVIKGDSQWQSDLASTQERMRDYPTAPRERLPLPSRTGPTSSTGAVSVGEANTHE
jgi:MSHA biogenesis protein MshL